IDRMSGNGIDLLFLLFFLFISIDARAILNEGYVVHTSLGTIRGVEQKFDGAIIGAYLGVPYGRSPIGSRRFQRPQMAERWANEFSADKLARSCYFTLDNTFPQFPGAEMWNPPNQQDENCLNMNIWVPREHDGSVLVWIYGGGFFSGSPSLDLYDGSVLAALHNVIVVNINYRLGPFGFMYLGEESPVSGNMGLLDQQLALKWIHHNIAAFGGDPKRVTLFGESAGSASTTAHLIAPGSRHYFHKIIAKSGAIINSWATRSKQEMLDVSFQLVRRLNCSNSDHELILKCLSDVQPAIVQREADDISNAIHLPMTFAFVPVEEDNYFFKGNVFDKIRRRDFKKDVSALVGTVKDEGTYWLPYYMSDGQFGFKFNHTISPEDPFNSARINREQYKKSLEAFLPYFGNSPLVKHALMNAYQDVPDRQTFDRRDEEKLRDGVARFLGDYFFTCGLTQFADLLSDSINGPLYMYYFTMRSTANPWPRWMGVMHGYEIEYAFGLPLRRPQLYRKDRLEVEQSFSKKIMQMWINFANSGSPSSFWPKYNRIDKRSLELNENIVTGGYYVGVDVHGEGCRLINEGNTFSRQLKDCRANRLDLLSSSSLSIDFSSTVVLVSLITLLRVL
ncbi:hypothetical protein PFISCL1PPCAC_19591, partial [Pristionchus fissidentatus]